MDDKIKIYIAAPIVGVEESWKKQIDTVKNRLYKSELFDIYDPTKHGVPNAWGMNMEEWSHCIFTMDVVAIDNCDWVVVCDFGRENTSGTSWEAGYAFGKNKKILTIRMYDSEVHYSVMMNGCCSNYINYSSLLLIESDELLLKLFTERGRNQPDTVFD